MEFAEHTWVILSLLAFGSLFGSLTTVPNLITMGLGYSRIVGLFSIVSAFFYVIFLPLLTSWFGLEGKGWAMVASTLPGLFLVGYELRNIFHFELLSYWNAALGIHLIPAVLVLLSYRWWNTSEVALSFVPGGVLLVMFCIYVGILVARGYIPIGQWGKELLKHR
jgi:O-antigen/teichoic acid export membrane protein